MSTAPSSIEFDKDQAAKAGRSLRISEGGAYIGKLKKVRHTVYESGSEGLVIDFEDQAGQSARSLRITLKNKNGDNNDIGQADVAGMMAIMRISGTLEPEEMPDEQWDSKEKKMVPCKTWQFPQLCVEPIGLVLQKEQYTNNRTGRDAWRLNYVAAFDPVSRKTSAEAISGDEATYVNSITKNMQDIDSRENRRGADVNLKGATSAVSSEFDDDIPF